MCVCLFQVNLLVMNSKIRLAACIVTFCVIMGGLTAFGQDLDPSNSYSVNINPPKPTVTSQTILRRIFPTITPQYSTPTRCSIGYVYDPQSRTCTRTVKVPTTDNAFAACQFKFNECTYENARIQAEIIQNCVTIKMSLDNMVQKYKAECANEYVACVTAERSLLTTNSSKSQAEIDAEAAKALKDLLAKPK